MLSIKNKLSILFLLITISANAQVNKNPNKVKLGYGFPNIPVLALNTDIKKNSAFGPIIFSYEWTLKNKRFSFGPEFTYAAAKSKTLTANDMRTKYNYNMQFYTFLLRGNYHYSRKEKLELYSGAALGAFKIAAKAKTISGNGTPEKFSDAQNGFAFHINLIGANFLIKKSFGVYSELGFGYRGIANVGLYKSW